MLSRLSVKKPFIILAITVVIMMLGAFSLTYMQTNLLPSIELPYLAVITADPGATPEQVENDVTDVLAGRLATVTGVENVSCVSYENFSMVYLEFAEDTNMDSAMVKVSAAVNEVSGTLPESAGTPTYLEISMDSIATMYLGVSDDELDIAELSEFVDTTMIPALERQEGVASVSASGIVTDKVEINLSQGKIDDVNNRILANVNSKLYDSKRELEDAQSQIDGARATLEKQQAELDEAQKQTQEQLANSSLMLDEAIAVISTYKAQLATLQASQTALEAQIEAALKSGNAQLAAQLQAQLGPIEAQRRQIEAAIEQLNAQAAGQGGSVEDGYKAIEQGQMDAATQFATARSQIASALAALDQSQAQIDSGYEAYEDARQQAINAATIDALMTPQLLSQMISAQDLSMPAGYIEDDQGNAWMLRVGEGYDSLDELSRVVLTSIDGMGDIRLCDVADIGVVNDEGQSYAKLNGRDGLILSITKTSTASTSEVSKELNAQIDRLLEENPTLRVMTLTDQGEYITLYINTILQSLLVGAVLAVVVLALFLRSVKPTIVIAFSIPFSVLFSLVIMYFMGIDINIMTLGSLSLAIGMLVDNSVVVMENIYRLRARGYSAARAAVQGAIQVSAAVTASTLTTICVFLPFVFTTGIVRQLLVPFALALSFTMLASLIVALTVVPAMSSKLFERLEPKEHRWFERLKERYGIWLDACLRHKAPVLVVAVALLAVSIVAVMGMGISLIPPMESQQVSVSVTMPEDIDQDEARKRMDQIVDAIGGIEGVADVGAADDTTALASFSSALGNAAADAFTGSFSMFVIPDESIVTEAQMLDLRTRIVEATADIDAQVVADNGSSMMSAMMQQGLTITLLGPDSNTLLDLSEEVMAAVDSIEGYSEIENGQEEADKVLQLTFKRDEVARQGTTVAQIYQQIAGKMNSSAESIKLEGEQNAPTVQIEDNRNQLTVENILDMEYTVETTGLDGSKTTQRHTLAEVATVSEQPGLQTIEQTNGKHSMQVSASIDEGYNTTLLARQLQPLLDKIDVPRDYSIEIAGTDQQIATMIEQMLQLVLLGAVLIYLIMMAQFQSFLSPLIVILTVPLAFTGGMIALLAAGEQLSMMSLLGFVILMGTVVNNGIVLVDYINQLRMAGMERRDALIAAGKTRMRPILMTALTTILAMAALIFNPLIGAGMQRGMALVVAGGLLYATVMTLIVVPIVYDIIYKKPVKVVDVGDDIDAANDDAEYFLGETDSAGRKR